MAKKWDSWSDLIPVRSDFSTEQMNAASALQRIICVHSKHLFAEHSNLIAIRAMPDGEHIEFIVPCKGFVPAIDHRKLPKELEGIPTKVTAGWAAFTGKNERKHRRPLIPGAGIAPEPIARVCFDVEPYIPPSLGTLGGFVYHNNKYFGVTCGHCVCTSKDTELFPVVDM